MNSRIPTIVILLLALLTYSCTHDVSPKIESESAPIDLVKVKEVLQKLDDQFAESFNTGDSVAIAEHYSKDGTWGDIEGKDNLASAWGKWLRYANEKGTPHMKLKKYYPNLRLLS